jgi:pimeloyl-ACP methyl ester carboxylesterase
MSDPNFMPLSSPDRQDISIAYRHDGALDKPQAKTGLFWLGGFMSDMEGSKAQVLADLAENENRPSLRFDYSGHGASGGKFADGTVSKWLEESIAVFRTQTSGSRLIVGSSMGGWIALLLYRYFRQNSPEIAARIKGIVLIAPAADMTRKLMWEKYDDKTRAEISENGLFAEPSEYGDDPYIITRDLIEDGKKHCLLDQGLAVDCPVRILQGDADPDVPWQHAMAVYSALKGDNVLFLLVKSGDHRLSTPANLELLRQTCRQLFALAEAG